MPQSNNFFPSLEEIYMRKLPKFKGWEWEWERRGNRIEEEDGDSSSSSSLLMLPCFSDKVDVRIDECPRLSYMLHGQQLFLHQHDLLFLPVGPQRSMAVLVPTDPYPSPSPSTISDSVSLTALTSLSISKIEDAEQLPVELFQSLPSLQSLEINRCPRLKALPLGAIQSLPSLQNLRISDCPRLGAELQLPQLPSLKRISLSKLENLEHIELSEGGTMPQSNLFPSLEEISLWYLPKFKGWEWERRGNRIEEEDGDSSSSSSSLLMLPCFSDKVKVEIYGCPRFSYMHGQQQLGLVGWRMRNVTALLLHQRDPLLLPLGPQRPMAVLLPTDPSPSTDSLSLTALTSLSISEIEDAEHLPVELFQSLPSLQSLIIKDCPRLKALPLGAIQSLPSLQNLCISDCPRFGAELQLPQLPSLKRIILEHLENLEHIELWEDGTMPQSNFFPSLEEITLWGLPKFKGWEWERRGNRIEEEDGDSSSSSSLLIVLCFSDKVKVNIFMCPRFSYMLHGQQLFLHQHDLLFLHQHDLLFLPLGPQRSMAVLVPTDPYPSPSPSTISDSLSLTALTSLTISEIEDAEHLPVELFQSLPSLQSLIISNCPRLKALPLGAIFRYISTLETLKIYDCPELDLSTENGDDDDGGGNAEGMTNLLQLQGHHKLCHLSICGVHKMECLPGWFINFAISNLQSLTIRNCKGLKSLLPGRLILPLLTTLDSLELHRCPELDLSIGESEDMPMAAYSQFTKLRNLAFDKIEKMETLPWWIQHLTNLESLSIRFCKNLKALPEWFPNLTSLKHLLILYCGEELTRRCQGENGGGEDWPKISHIPHVEVRR
ncbi:uncharacterized protein LOC116189619 isoform X1 [Punica granatum]|nr:uncharacterized protein LOC116189619 isoform X1 [Punica granatum]XP_031375210.1 uncharacterized protein LOC116189619 isoform X1 [Punica granatum]XP_031375211.1 uncharacterized protein LOC116189619 isoform X1 [Punica granatum]XP_031375212.1 uncharacterized protein LOC116189619 isoform X1 [Punica granatum]XP_031375213.1 uncharacterized protein LOC116189619 isoform X1 [Punica granatum]XP_031375214.1 uncharacterized protein LOC116189619 isoform X1 [Punica granatum]XP_031375215.1 uncharacterize